MITLHKTKEFDIWLHSLKNKVAKTRILARLKNASMGNFGYTKSIGSGVFEMKIDVGSGYRVYYAKQDTVVYLLISGGDKSTQENDIKYAKKVWSEIKNTFN